MQNAQIIAREALKELLKEGKEPTPEFYAEAFYAQAKKIGVNVGEVDFSIEKILEMLDKEIKESLFNRKFKNKNELIAALVHSINHLFFYKRNFSTQLEIVKLLLRLLATHPHKEISMLAKGQLLEIDKLNAKSIQMWRERWAEQIKGITELDFIDLAKGLEILSGFKISSSSFCQWQQEARNILKTKSSKEVKINLLNKLESILKEQFTKITQDTKESPQVNPSKATHKPKPKVSAPLKYHQASSLPIDAMTTLVSRQGMEEVLEFAELQFQNHHKNYSVIVFGISAYDKIKGHFGLEAAKRVLATLGRLLKQYSNESDLIAYYSEEEFLACLLEREREEAIQFIRNLDSIVSQSIFMFQQTRINISLSAQVSHRVESESLENMLKVSLEEFSKHKDSKGIINYES
ncbi:diguanylate cyclase [uncultured Helicobacter sp.]|uniref:diguanylate cyclase domain-containing protein n=1 Tax=uncultured Helicobacter sp. TaxID=175537 RepID=UPI00261FCF9D|nr:diguanylate cyclase [uncultured Helicobacter sp.]